MTKPTAFNYNDYTAVLAEIERTKDGWTGMTTNFRRTSDDM